MVVVLEPSEMEKQVGVTVVNDIFVEDSEVFTGMLSLLGDSEGVSLGSTITATATILDDDGKIFPYQYCVTIEGIIMIIQP